MLLSGTRFVDGPQCHLRVDDGGEGGVPVVFVHGGAGRLEQWSEQLAHLRPSRRAIALDLRGHGESELPCDEDYSIEAMADDVLGVADELGVSRFVAVGHSAGTGALAVLAAAHPERLAGLVLVDGGIWVPSPAEIEELRRGFRPDAWAAFGEGWFEPLLVGARRATRTAVLASLRATPRAVFAASIYGAMGYDPRPPIAGFPGPKLAIASRLLDGPQALQRAVPGLPFSLVDGASHWVMMDAPEETDARLDEFLAAVR